MVGQGRVGRDGIGQGMAWQGRKGQGREGQVMCSRKDLRISSLWNIPLPVAHRAKLSL